MAVMKPYITIKGTKDGLVLQMDDSCAYQDLIEELTQQLEHHRSHFLDGPLIHVTLESGYRYITPEQEAEIKSVIRSKGNLVVDQLESEVVTKDQVEQARLQADIQLIHKTVRAGQQYQLDGNVLVVGDINSGGMVQAAGNIFVLGALRGMAHAGYQGDTAAIIAASILQPTQLRIADVFSRPPDEWDQEEYWMEFAYIDQEQIRIEKNHHLAKIRPDLKRYV